MEILSARNLCKTFKSRRQTVEVVRGIDLSAYEGEVLAFLGPNGAGKTTTIKMIAGLIRPDAGSVRIAGLDPQASPEALRMVGAVLEGNRNLYWRLTPEENLEYFGVLKGMSAVNARQQAAALLERFGLQDKRRTMVQKLSRGMQQKVALAAALIHRPKLLLLDEPTLGLDVEAAEAVKSLVHEIANEKRCVILTTHQLHVAQEISHRVTIINNGQIQIQETTPELLKRYRGNTYQVFVEGELGDERTVRLRDLGASVDDGNVVFRGDSHGLYEVLDALRPLPIIKLERDRSDLTGIFLELIRRERNG